MREFIARSFAFVEVVFLVRRAYGRETARINDSMNRVKNELKRYVDTRFELEPTGYCLL
jgi:hypothetical protein